MYQNLANYNFNNNQAQDSKSDHEIVNIFPARPQNSKGTARFLKTNIGSKGMDQPSSNQAYPVSLPDDSQATTTALDARSSLPTNPHSLGPLSEPEHLPPPVIIDEKSKMTAGSIGINSDLRRIHRQPVSRAKSQKRTVLNQA